MKKDSEKFWLSKHFAFGDKTPIFASAGEFEEMAQIIENSIKDIKQSKSSRLIILETWLVLDYIVRRFIISGLNLNKFSNKDFNIAFDFLPQSFDKCLKFLENFIKNQAALPPNPERNQVGFRGKFIYFMIKEHKDFYDKQLVPILRKYYKKYYPELTNTAKTFEQMEQEKKMKFSIDVSSPSITTRRSFIFNQTNTLTYREVDSGWFEIAQSFNKQWFVDARKINTSRNKSAHEIKSEVIYRSIEISGKDEEEKFKKLKEFCIQQLSTILDIHVPKRKRKNLDR